MKVFKQGIFTDGDEFPANAEVLETLPTRNERLEVWYLIPATEVEEG